MVDPVQIAKAAEAEAKTLELEASAVVSGWHLNGWVALAAMLGANLVGVWLGI